MNPSEFWKNFRLNEEIHISGTFIYNGLRRFHELKSFDHSDELFEFLYELSVGLERLLKCAVVLYEHNETYDQEALEKSLITHNHLDLMARLRDHVELKLGPTHNDLMSLLGTFYKTLRYDRFSLTSAYEGKKEATAILRLLSKHFETEVPADDSWFGAPNEDRFRKYMRRAVLKISNEVYRAIRERAGQINLYTYELRHGSKASSVFQREIDMAHEDILWKELLIFFMNGKVEGGYFKFLKDTPSLKFDPYLISDYLECFQSDTAKSAVMDELEHHYQQMGRDEISERHQRIAVIGASHVYFNDEEEGEGDDMANF
jgi:hypothetical protein